MTKTVDSLIKEAEQAIATKRTEDILKDLLPQDKATIVEKIAEDASSPKLVIKHFGK